VHGQAQAEHASQWDGPVPMRVQVQIFVEKRLVGHEVTQKPSGDRWRGDSTTDWALR
jgi:hypothetical protein